MEETISVHHFWPHEEAKWLARYSELVCAGFRLQPPQQTAVIGNSVIRKSLFAKCSGCHICLLSYPSPFSIHQRYNIFHAILSELLTIPFNKVEINCHILPSVLCLLLYSGQDYMALFCRRDTLQRKMLLHSSQLETLILLFNLHCKWL
jgi:hypothetical protein